MLYIYMSHVTFLDSHTHPLHLSCVSSRRPSSPLSSPPTPPSQTLAAHPNFSHAHHQTTNLLHFESRNPFVIYYWLPVFVLFCHTLLFGSVTCNHMCTCTHPTLLLCLFHLLFLCRLRTHTYTHTYMHGRRGTFLTQCISLSLYLSLSLSYSIFRSVALVLALSFHLSLSLSPFISHPPSLVLSIPLSFSLCHSISSYTRTHSIRTKKHCIHIFTYMYIYIHRYVCIHIYIHISIIHIYPYTHL